MKKTLSALVLTAAALAVAGCSGGRTTTLPGDAAPATGTVVASAPAPTVATVGSPAPRTTPAPSAEQTAAPLNFWNYGFVSAVDAVDGVVTVDVIQYFGGKDAVRACAQDGLSASGAWCSNYYWRNTNPLERDIPLATGATITKVAYGAKGLDIAAPGTLTDVRTQVAEEGKSVYKFYVDGGKITQLQAVYLP